MTNCFDAAVAAKPAPAKIFYVVAVALVDPDGRVLLAQRPPGKKMAGLWEFPGGKIENGETPEHALVRELHEELGIDTTASCLAPLTFASHAYDDFHLFMPVFVCRVWKGAVMSKEGQSFAWVYPKDFNKYPMPPADIPLIPILRELL
ncbi:MAG: (deoxy)nucleoside triphosphate pyrophosphohydrolase [Alphaproteobacteria bacterium]